MSEELLKGNIVLGQAIRLTVKNDEIVPVSVKSAKAAKPKAAEPAEAAPAGEENPVG